MIIKPHYGMSLLILGSALQLRADCDWKDVATAGLIGAGIGAACVYAATCNDNSCDSYSPHYDSSYRHKAHRLKRAANDCYEKIYSVNKQLINAYCFRSDQTISLITRKGKEYQAYHWFITSPYIDEECIRQAPLLRGYAALLNEATQLRMQRDNLIDFFGSRHAAQFEYANFANLEHLANLLYEIATRVEQQKVFIITRDTLQAYRLHKEELARTRLKLQAAQNELTWQRRPAYTNGYDYYYTECLPSQNQVGVSFSFYN